LLGSEALAAAFDALPLEAYLIDGNGRIVAANALGRARIGVGASVPSHAAVAAVPAMPGLHVLVITPAHDAKARLAVASLLWHLTSREQEVLDLVVRGQSNKEASNALGCTESTVGVHVKHMTHKAGTDRRGLVARFWSLGGEEEDASRKDRGYGDSLHGLLRYAPVGAPRSARRAGGTR